MWLISAINAFPARSIVAVLFWPIGLPHFVYSLLTQYSRRGRDAGVPALPAVVRYRRFPTTNEKTRRPWAAGRAKGLRCTCMAFIGEIHRAEDTSASS
jgi:hypothetical protein